MIIFNRTLSIEYRVGVGFDLEFPDSRPVWCTDMSTGESITMPFQGVFDLEFPDSRPVWCTDMSTGESITMPFQGVILHLPLCLVSYGRVYDEIEI
jgi:hypothetical protein